MQKVSRLIKKFVPHSYKLSLTVNRKDRRFDGIVTIEGHSIAGFTDIDLHSKDLFIISITFDGKEAEYSYGENDELRIIHPDITEGSHIIVVSFSGKITSTMHGIYPCFYKHDGQQKELIATQFESHHAREVFPCIDEPEAKATFDVTLTTEQHVCVLGNMPIKTQRVESDFLVTSFETTPRMSSYLLAWVIGELHSYTGKTKSGVDVAIWATPAQSTESLKFACDIAIRTIDFFNEYFQVPYPLAKSDHVALPDFTSGAMENWGLVTYREIALLAHPDTTSISNKHYIATVIAHELSHQWFGNLVTMKWWNNLWLNESFATLMEYIAIDAIEPDWNVWLDFATGESIMALRRDSIDGVQAVQIDVNHPDEISALFDGAIVYAKGARLLRMLQQYIGQDAFRAGLQSYFTKFAYDNTEADDLWSEFEASSGKDISHFMNTWISQSGFPMVSAQHKNDVLTVSQSQFFTGAHKKSSKIWPIPLSSNIVEMPSRLDKKNISIPLKTTKSIRLNVGDSAHFITKYDDNLLEKLVKKLESKEFNALDRLQLLHEQTLLARAGEISNTSIVSVLLAYKNEAHEAVWDIISLAFGELKKFVENDKVSEKNLRSFSGKLAENEYLRLGWEQKNGETEADTKLRATIISLMIYSERKDVIDIALEKYQRHSLETLDPELRSLIIGVNVRHSNDIKIVETLINTYKTTVSSELQNSISSGVCATREKQTITMLLELIKNSETIRPQDAIRWYAMLIRNHHGRELAWNWLRNNWDWIDKMYGSDKSYDDFVRYTAASLVTRQQYDEFKIFFNPKKSIPALSRVVSLGLTEIESRVELIEKDQQAVRRKLAEL